MKPTSNQSSSSNTTMMSARSTSLPVTRSIPIARDWKLLQDEANEAQDAKMADFQDYIFYSRIMSGLKAKQSKSRCLDLRYQNQILIDHIRDTRYSDCDSMSSGESVTSDDDLTTRDALTKALELVKKTEEEEDMMFEMDI
eukprot:CAMPEP_0113623736 /NCGR_PEP_ID=MMETSP0017_2-20120614/12217_1 /TAXON_ID=2856 /ORGANISM="Cylindrotheca closterium" /LENGTH=140 /DNA_ID=CAMNT_0000533707 /DNA_START=72 /DNA_END=494 /DNA_ORIENTATION=+ /assembly_acc=CAM_ASM_000147